MITILNEQQQLDVTPVGPTESGLWLTREDLARATGFELKPEGLCKGEICVPVPRNSTHLVDSSGAVDVAAFWRHMGQPVVHDDARTTWVLGSGARERAAALESFEAPDFRLPDLDGRMHALSEQRGRKVLLVTWASW
jgi:hypothetical protein